MAGNYFLAQFSGDRKMLCLLYKMTVICTFSETVKKQIKHSFSTTVERERIIFADNYRVVAWMGRRGCEVAY
jgi:hypothetical protein